MQKFLIQLPSETIMTSRFDLEQQILGCWNLVDELDFVCELVQDNDKAMNVLLGLKELYQLKFEKCFNTFEQCLPNKQI
jgi:hypothetical protein